MSSYEGYCVKCREKRHSKDRGGAGQRPAGRPGYLPGLRHQDEPRSCGKKRPDANPGPTRVVPCPGPVDAGSVRGTMTGRSGRRRRDAPGPERPAGREVE